MKVIFIMGAFTDMDLQKKIEIEAQRFHDIIQEDFCDSYRWTIA